MASGNIRGFRPCCVAPTARERIRGLVAALIGGGEFTAAVCPSLGERVSEH
jgi:hypothetical protein